MLGLSTSTKGAAAEAEIAACAIRLGLIVLRPLCEGSRYDLALDTGSAFVRVQCKWAALRGDVLTARCITSRHTPAGYRKTRYCATEIDALGAYAAETDRCYLLPIAEVADRSAVSLRIGPTRNNQSRGVHWARDYEMDASLKRFWGLA